MPLGGLLSADLISGGANVLGGLLGSGASKTASKQNVGWLESGINALQQAGNASGNVNQQYLTAQTNLTQPYVNAGTFSLSQLMSGLGSGGNLNPMSLLSMTPNQILSQNPGYNFQLQQGDQAIQRGAAAQGTGATGGELKDLTTYSQGLAENAYQNAFSNYLTSQQQQVSNLMGTAGLGATETNVQNQNYQNFIQNYLGTTMGTAQGIAGLDAAAGGVQGAGTLGSANSISGMLSGLGTTAVNVAGLNNLSNNSSLSLASLLGKLGNGGILGTGSAPLSSSASDPFGLSSSSPALSALLGTASSIG